MSFTANELELIAGTKEVSIETWAGDRVYPTVIWIVVAHDTVYVRCVSGASGRWYQRALANPGVALDVGGTRLPARAIPATDAASIEACSEGLRVKYRTSRSVDSMLVPEVLDTTLRLERTS